MMPRRLVKWVNRHPRSTGLILLMSVAIPGFISQSIIIAEQNRDMQCVASWADQFTARSEALVEPAKKKDEAEDRLIRAVAMNDPELFRSALAEYVEASDELAAVREEQPIPEAPRFQCPD